jgi:hypothetical protein
MSGESKKGFKQGHRLSAKAGDPLSVLSGGDQELVRALIATLEGEGGDGIRAELHRLAGTIGRVDASVAGAGVRDVSMASGGKKLDDVSAAPLLDAPHGSSAAADEPLKVPANVSEFTVDVGGVVAANNVLLDANAELTRKLAALEQDSKNLVEIRRQSPLLRQRAEACHADMAVAANNELSLDNLELVRKVAALEENNKKLKRAVHVHTHTPAVAGVCACWSAEIFERRPGEGSG